MKFRKILSFLLIAVPMAAVFLIAFSNQELSDAFSALRGMDARYLAGMVLCWFCYVFFDALGGWIYLRSQGFPLSLGRALLANFIGLYYSNITPSAAGGQPMQVNSLRKAGIPVAYGTMMATVRFISNQFMVSLISLALWIANRDFVARQLGGAVWIARVGWIINAAVIPVVLLAAFKKSWILSLAGALLRLLEKLRLVRNREAAYAGVQEIMDTYHTALRELLHHGGQIVLQFLLGALSLLAMMCVPLFVYRALGQSGVPPLQLLTLSYLVFVSASYTPRPGASGAQEGGFLLYFQGIFTGGTIGLALLIWRFFTYYLFLLVGCGIALLERVLLRRKKGAASGGKYETKAGISSHETSDNRRPGV